MRGDIFTGLDRLWVRRCWCGFACQTFIVCEIYDGENVRGGDTSCRSVQIMPLKTNDYLSSVSGERFSERIMYLTRSEGSLQHECTVPPDLLTL